MLGRNGGLLGKRRVPALDSASGLWSSNEQNVAKQDNIWPRTDGYRYFRFDQITASTTLTEISEWVLTANGVYVTGGTWTASGAGIDYLNSAAMSNSILNARAFQMGSPASSAYLQYDHGSVVSVTGMKYSSYFAATSRYITGFRVRGSFDNVTYITIATKSELSNPFTADGQLSPEIVF